MIIRGRSATIEATIYLDKANGILADLSGATIYTIFKKREEDLDTEKLFEKSIGSGVTVVSATAGTIKTVINPVDTNSLTVKKIVYETVAKLADGTLIGNGVKTIEIYGNVRKILP
jgi:translation initiation factor 1 (eIF-1/SUI1)